MYAGRESGADTKMREGSGLLENHVGFSIHLLGLSFEADKSQLSDVGVLRVPPRSSAGVETAWAPWLRIFYRDISFLYC